MIDNMTKFPKSVIRYNFPSFRQYRSACISFEIYTHYGPAIAIELHVNKNSKSHDIYRHVERYGDNGKSNPLIVIEFP